MSIGLDHQARRDCVPQTIIVSVHNVPLEIERTSVIEGEIEITPEGIGTWAS